jgi:diaminopimelate epimerase
MSIHFWKMHGLGNDFVIIDSRKTGYVPDRATRLRIADRHTGVGFDQLIILLPPKSSGADVYMDIYNPDASGAGACGNATRCVARLLFEESEKKSAVIETVSGLLPVTPKKDLFEVDIATPKFDWQDIPLVSAQDTLKIDLTVGALAQPCGVNVGNPHAVFFVSNVGAVPLTELGPRIEQHPLFPDRVNVEIAQILSPNKIRMRVWERGAGITMACGSGACATLVAAVRRGLTERRAEIVLDGGSLWVEWRETDNRVILVGAATLSYTGILAPELLAFGKEQAT